MGMLSKHDEQQQNAQQDATNDLLKLIEELEDDNEKEELAFDDAAAAMLQRAAFAPSQITPDPSASSSTIDPDLPWGTQLLQQKMGARRPVLAPLAGNQENQREIMWAQSPAGNHIGPSMGS